MIIAIGAEKGGTGKTTLSLHLAALTLHQKKDILLVDTDHQGSATKVIALRDEENHTPRIPSIQKHGLSLPQDIKNLAPRYEHIIIDIGGKDNKELRGSMAVADRIYIPLCPSQLDAFTISNIDDLVAESKMYNPNLEAFFILSRTSSISESVETVGIIEAMKTCENIGYADLKIVNRIIYSRSLSDGLGVTEYKPRNKEAINEIEKIYAHIFDIKTTS